MNGIDVIKTALDRTRFALNWYVSDLSDADLFVRPVPAANHIAWQFGNVIVGGQFNRINATLTPTLAVINGGTGAPISRRRLRMTSFWFRRVPHTANALLFLWMAAGSSAPCPLRSRHLRR